MSTAVRETLDSVVSPAVRDAIIAAALLESGAVRVPSDVTGFREFVRGPLLDALVTSLGDEVAESVVRDLERLGCSIPPTLRPAAPDGRRASQPRIPAIGPLRTPRGLTPAPPPSRHSSVPPRRSLTPWPRPAAPRVRSLTPRPGVTHPSELPPPPTPAALSCSASTRALDPLAELPDLYAHLREESYPAPPFSGRVPAQHNSPFGSGELPAVAPRPAPPSESGRPLVIVATRDARLVKTLTEWMHDRAEVIRVTNVLDLVQHAAAPGALVVLDCHRPAVRPVAAAALAEELPEATRVVLWGPSLDDELAVQAISPATTRWIRCEAAAPASLAKRCVELVS